MENSGTLTGGAECDTRTICAGNADRTEAFAQGPPRLPARFAYYVLGAILVLGVGGLLLEQLFSALGLNPTSSPAAGTTPTLPGSPGSALPAPLGPSQAIAAGDRSLMGLTDAGSKIAPSLSLSTGPGHPFSLGQLSGKVVVVTFFDEPCDDICPVMASEIASADAALGPAARRVAFVTVDTDPLAVDRWPAPRLIFHGRAAPPNWAFASGTLSQLNQAWLDYGITVDVFRASETVTHTDRMYFIDPSGRLRYLSTPFANEAGSGRYTLPATTVTRWGQAMAAVATGLMR